MTDVVSPEPCFRVCVLTRGDGRDECKAQDEPLPRVESVVPDELNTVEVVETER